MSWSEGTMSKTEKNEKIIELQNKIELLENQISVTRTQIDKQARQNQVNDLRTELEFWRE